MSTDDATPMDVGYAYASNVDTHRLVVIDVCDVKDLLDGDPIDFDAINVIYTDGKNSVKDDGVRTIAGFATGEDKKHGLSDFYGTPAPLDEFVSSAIAGTGVFEGAPDDVRSQGVEKGMQNQIMIAWVVHELNSAIAKAQDGNLMWRKVQSTTGTRDGRFTLAPSPDAAHTAPLTNAVRTSAR